MADRPLLGGKNGYGLSRRAGRQDLQRRLYKLAVTGYEGRTNTLNLFDLDTIDESIVHDGITFDKTDIDKNLTLFLYPDDSDEAGRRLRVYQQLLYRFRGPARFGRVRRPRL